METDRSVPVARLAPAAARDFVRDAGASFGLQCVRNARAAARDAPLPPACAASVGKAPNAAAAAALSSWPGFAPAPLVALPALAAAMGVASVQLKAEGGRFGIGSFKALGAPYAMARLLGGGDGGGGGGGSGGAGGDGKCEGQGECEGLGGLAAGRGAGRTFSTASDGNHGVAVAWAARRCGAAARVYLHTGVSAARVAAVERLGAVAVRAGSTYEASVAACREDSAAHGYEVVQDVSWAGYERVPADICAGYTVVASELLAQLVAAGEAPPTHVLVNCGVGGFAAAVCGLLWDALGAARPAFITAEPAAADCVLRSGAAGTLTPCPGDLDTVQGGLACGEVSPLAFDVLRGGTDAFCSVSDACVAPAMRLLASASPAFVAGESAVCGLAVAAAAAADPAAKAALGLGPGSRVLCIACEGATDEGAYERITGRSLHELAASPWCFRTTALGPAIGTGGGGRAHCK